MKFNDRIFEDLTRVVGGAASAFGGFRDQFDARASAGVAPAVSREEFESVREMAARAREANEDLLKRIAALEARLPGGENQH